MNIVVKSRLFRELGVAKDAALKAGEFLQKKCGRVQVLRKKALRDDLLDVDLAAEKIIIRILQANFPNYNILSEETPIENTGSSYQWVVDPLDGSFNFQHGNPTFGISISLRVNNTTQVGVVYLPFYKEMFSAIRGYGAHLQLSHMQNGHLRLYQEVTPIRVSSTLALNDAIVHVGDFSKEGNLWDNNDRLHDIAQLANAVGRVRMIGTAATDLAYVACGRAEALVVHNALPWDIEVGQLLIEEAGGRVTYQKDENGRSVAICSNKNVHQELLKMILSQKGEVSSEYIDSEYGKSLYPFPNSLTRTSMSAQTWANQEKEEVQAFVHP